VKQWKNAAVLREDPICFPFGRYCHRANVAVGDLNQTPVSAPQAREPNLFHIAQPGENCELCLRTPRSTHPKLPRPGLTAEVTLEEFSRAARPREAGYAPPMAIQLRKPALAGGS